MAQDFAALDFARVRAPLRWGLVLVAVLLQVAQLRTGPMATVPVLAGALALPAALLQGLGVVGQRRRPLLGALAISLGYLIQVLAVGVVPGYVGWLAIALSPHPGTGPARRSRAAAIATVAVSLVLGVVAAALIHGDRGSTVPTLLLIEAVVLLGTALSWARHARARAVIRGAADARLRLLAEERLRIARDLHDLVGHGLSTIAVQSSTARMAIDAGNLVEARAAVAAVEVGSRDALREMRQMLGVLRQGQPNRDEQTSPAPGLRDLPALLERVRSAGVDVTSDDPPVADEVPADVQLAAFRIVQESLTNIISHAPGACARVAIQLDGEQLHIDILDSGSEDTVETGPSLGSPPWAGMGLVGMRERAEFLKGSLEAGPHGPGRGWRVSALLPLTHE